MAGRLWLTGALYILAGIGFVFYAILWGVRYVQTHVKTALAGTAIVLAGAGVGWWCCTGRSGGGTVEYEVKPGVPLRRVARDLQVRGVIRWAPALVTWMKLNGSDRRVEAGLHRFECRESVFGVARRLQRALPCDVAVTVPEGLTVEQTAMVVAREAGVDSGRFVALCADEQFLRTLGLEERSAEGYLFPDTYRLVPGVAAESVISTMIGRFRDQYARVRFDSTVAGRMGQREVVILASIIEKEATLAEECARISGVFHNRLRRGMSLGADPTVRYALRKFEGPLYVSELNSPHPYNTRVHRGLPPGPICSPGFAALQAAAAPQPTDELYFVAKWDGSGGHDFSKTLAEHERKKHDIRRRNEQRLRELKVGG